jgi:DNA-binding transcriptional MerR regulator
MGILIGELAARNGLSRKAIRLYEAASILEKPMRTPAGYRVLPSNRVLEYFDEASGCT